MSIGFRFWTAAPVLAVLAVLAAVPAAAAQAAPPPSDTLPLHPARIPVGFQVEAAGLDASGQARVSLSENTVRGRSLSMSGRGRLLAVDGVPVRGWSVERVEMALVGPAGSTVELTIDQGVERTERMPRVPLPPPGLNLTRTVVTPHFVVHHAPGDELLARRAAAREEHRFARVAHPADTRGRRGHVYVVPDSMVMLPTPFWARLTSERDRSPVSAAMHGYVAFGVPGNAARMVGMSWGLPEPGDRVHRGTVPLIVPGANLSLGMAPWATSPEASSRGAYVRERYGMDRFLELWRAEEPYDAAVRRVLGTTSERLEADWKRHVLSLGPSRDAGPGLAGLGLALGWGALVALGGVWAARRREAR